MSDEQPRPEEAAELRRRAEAIARKCSPDDPNELSPEQIRQMLHELRVHQIELEMQNEELRRVQLELEESRARYFDLYNLAPVGYCTLSEQGLILEANLTAATMLGVSRSELAKKPVTRFVVKEDQDCYYRHRKPLFETGYSQACDLRMVKQDGAVFWVHLEAAVARDAAGAPVCRLVMNDITERKRQEAETSRLESRLRQSQKLEAVGQLASGVAHDFNNLLMVINGYVELAQELIPTDHPARPPLTTVLDAAAQATAVTQALLTFSRSFEATIEPVALATVIDESSRLLRRLLPRSIDLAVEALPESQACVLADRVQLKQVILNLATNARDAMPEGGHLRISCRPAQDHDLPGSVDNARPVCIEVSDTGTGIAPELLDRIFEPFFTTKSRGKGTGLGLSIVHGIVESLGGRIEVRSEVGKGSKFTVVLPGRTGVTGDEKIAPRPDAARGQGETVLVADDNVQILSLLTGALESRGYDVILAGDGEQMLSFWMNDRERIRLIVADNDMPKLTGLAALLRIRQAGGMLPAILVTGAVELDDDDRLDPGTILLRKPFQMTDLASQVRKMLDNGGQPLGS